MVSRTRKYWSHYSCYSVLNETFTNAIRATKETIRKTPKTETTKVFYENLVKIVEENLEIYLDRYLNKYLNDCTNNGFDFFVKSYKKKILLQILT